jgi:hypothetical protein
VHVGILSSWTPLVGRFIPTERGLQAVKRGFGLGHQITDLKSPLDCGSTGKKQKGEIVKLAANRRGPAIRAVSIDKMTAGFVKSGCAGMGQKRLRFVGQILPKTPRKDPSTSGEHVSLPHLHPQPPRPIWLRLPSMIQRLENQARLMIKPGAKPQWQGVVL